jgi:hypothetical protein
MVFQTSLVNTQKADTRQSLACTRANTTGRRNTAARAANRCGTICYFIVHTRDRVSTISLPITKGHSTRYHLYLLFFNQTSSVCSSGWLSTTLNRQGESYEYEHFDNWNILGHTSRFLTILGVSTYGRRYFSAMCAPKLGRVLEMLPAGGVEALSEGSDLPLTPSHPSSVRQKNPLGFLSLWVGCSGGIWGRRHGVAEKSGRGVGVTAYGTPFKAVKEGG